MRLPDPRRPPWISSGRLFESGSRDLRVRVVERPLEPRDVPEPVELPPDPVERPDPPEPEPAVKVDRGRVRQGDAGDDPFDVLLLDRPEERFVETGPDPPSLVPGAAVDR